MGKKKTKLTLEKKYNLTGWAFLLPAAILIFVFCFYPMAQAILLSFRKTGGSVYRVIELYQSFPG